MSILDALHDSTLALLILLQAGIKKKYVYLCY